MIQLLFYGPGDDDMFDMDFKDPAPNLPSRIVLDVNEPMQEFSAKVQPLEHLGIEVPMVLSEIFEHLIRKDEALYNLAISGYDIISEYTNTPIEKDAEQFAEARDSFGKAVYEILTLHRLYVQGVLFYQHCLCNDYGVLVLEKLQVPVDNEYRKQRSIARAAFTATGKQYRQALEKARIVRGHQQITEPRIALVPGAAPGASWEELGLDPRLILRR